MIAYQILFRMRMISLEIPGAREAQAVPAHLRQRRHLTDTSDHSGGGRAARKCHSSQQVVAQWNRPASFFGRVAKHEPLQHQLLIITSPTKLTQRFLSVLISYMQARGTQQINPQGLRIRRRNRAPHQIVAAPGDDRPSRAPDQMWGRGASAQSIAEKHRKARSPKHSTTPHPVVSECGFSHRYPRLPGTGPEPGKKVPSLPSTKNPTALLNASSDSSSGMKLEERISVS